MLPNMRGLKLHFTGIVVGCCLWVAAPGCQSQQGTLSDQSWLSVSNHFAWLQPHGAKNPDSHPHNAHSAEPIVDQLVADDKPELLPWRSRLRGYRLGARLARGRESDHNLHLDQTIAYSSMYETTRKPRARSLIASADDSSVDERPTPSLENGELQLPVSISLLPNRGRPHLMVD